MDELQKLLIKQACSELIVRVHNYVDDFEHAKIVALFAPDAVFGNAVVGGVLHGRDEIERYYNSKNRRVLGQHITSNIVIDVIDALHATGRSYFTFYFAGEGYTLPSPFDGPMAVGKYDDEFVCIDGAWKFSSRTMANRFQVGSLASYGLVNGAAEDPEAAQS
jgi:SnoaL-like domain